MENKSSSDLASIGNKNRAFYETPADRPIASSIINETRSWLNTVQTKRPFTPQTDTRSLFGNNSQRSAESRPPSTFSLGPRNFDTNPGVLDSSNRPSSGPRLAPLNKIGIKDKVLNDKVRTEIRRYSNAWEEPKDNHDSDRHKFRNVGNSMKNRTNSLSNISNATDKPVASKPAKQTTQLDSFWSGLPPTSPTRNKPKLKYSTSIQHLNSDKRISSEEISSRGSSAELSHVTHSPKQNQPAAIINNRPDSGSSCSSTSSTNVYRTPRYKTRSQSRHEHSEESETPRPPNINNDGGGDQLTNPTKLNITNSDNHDHFFKDTLAPILDILSAPVEFRKKDSTDDFINLTKLLYSKLEEKGMLGKHSIYRSEILKAVFKVLDSTNPILVISAAKIILSMVVRDVNLTNICKLIFRVSKNKNNDKLFEEFQMSNLLIQTLTSIKPDQSHTSLLYLMCTLKFLSKPEKQSTSEKSIHTKRTISDSLITAGLLPSIAKLLQKCIKLNEKHNVNKSFADFLNQCFSCLIHLESNVNIIRKYFVQNEIPLSAVIIIQQYHDNNDLVFEAFRLVSRLTQHADCCQMIEPKLSEFCPLCLQLMLNSQNDHLVLRIAFIIGDVLTRSEDARIALFPDKSSLEGFLKVCQIYIRKFQSTDENPDKSTEHSNEKDAASVDDIIVKLLRVIANAAIAESVGSMISVSKPCLSFILALINSRTILDKEELLAISISALNNISFYMISTASSEMKNNHIKIIESLYKIIANKNGKDHLGGIIRVLGNLSRETYMRDWIVENRLDEFLFPILDSDNQDTVFFTVGVILNLMTDPNKRHLLLKYNGITRLIEVLRDFASRDWQLAGLVCQTIWNYTEIINTTTESVLGGEQNTEELIQLLTMFTDPDEVDNIHLNYCSDNSTIEYLKNSWQTDFLPVATDLITRLELKINRFEPL